MYQDHLSDLRGGARLAVEATEGVTGVVEAMHGTIQRLAPPLGRSGATTPLGLTGFVYRTIKRMTRLVGHGLDVGLESLARHLPPGESSARRDAYRSVVNGICGDHLARSGNPLAIDMGLRVQGREIDPLDPGRALFAAGAPAPRGKVLLLVHGLCLNDRHWCRDGHDHGESLAAEFGYSPLYVHYNSGRSIAANGRDLAEIVENLVERWPAAVDELVILGHSMGGLVARGACHHAAEAGHRWPASLRKLIFLGTPHLGAPLERGGHQLQRALGLSPYSAPLARLGGVRSAGITDLRRGTVTEDRTPATWPPGVDVYAAAAVLAEGEERPFDGWVGDGLVPLRSALGEDRGLPRVAADRRWVGYGMGHLELLSHADVYRQLRRWVRGAEQGAVQAVEHREGRRRGVPRARFR